MMLLIGYLISFVASEISYSDTTLDVNFESTVAYADVAQYKDATSLIITSDKIEVQDQAFQGFTKLADITIKVSQEISIKSTSFNGCTSITSISIKTNSSNNIENGAFQSASTLIFNYECMYFDASMINFLTSNVEQLNIVGMAECTFFLSDALRSTVKTVSLAGSAITLDNKSFQESNIELLEIRTQELTFGEDSFKNAAIGEVQCSTKFGMKVSGNAFQGVSDIKLLSLESEKTIDIELSSFNSANIEELYLYAEKDISFTQQATLQAVNFPKITIITDGNFNAGPSSFVSSEVHEIYIRCGLTATFCEKSFQETPKLENLTVLALEDIIFEKSSFISSNVNVMSLWTEGSVIVNEQAFVNTKNLVHFDIHAIGDINFVTSSFASSTVCQIDLYANSTTIFGQESFINCKSLQRLSIYSLSDVTFGPDSFKNSDIQAISISWEALENILDASLPASSNTITFDQGSFETCHKLASVNVRTEGNVDVLACSFTNSSSLSELNIIAQGKVTVGSLAFAGCDALNEYNITGENGTEIAYDAFGGDVPSSSDSEDVPSSSDGGDVPPTSDGGYVPPPPDSGDVPPPSDDDGDDEGSSSFTFKNEDNESSAVTLGDIKIESVYLGASPNIYVNFNFLVKLMAKARKTFGKIVPAPELVHTAIWVGKKGATDSSVGAIFVYGKYWNKHNLPFYIKKTGAKAFVMTLGEFKKRYPSINPIKLNPHKDVKLLNFINMVKNSGKWSAEDYSWPTNNCQHFTAKLIDLLEASRETPNSDDWINLPKPVMKSLESHEK